MNNDINHTPPARTFDLTTFLSDPYNPLDTSGGDARLHVYRRLALCAFALQMNVEALTEKATQLIRRLPNRHDEPRHAIDELCLDDLLYVADVLEEEIDASCFS